MSGMLKKLKAMRPTKLADLPIEIYQMVLHIWIYV